MKRVIKNPIIMFILGALIFGFMGTVFAYSLLASNTGFTPKDSSWEVDNVEDAINDLKSRAIINPKFTNMGEQFYQGTRVQNKTLTKTVNKGRYIVSIVDSYSVSTSNSNTWIENSSSGYNAVLSCDKTCDLKLLNGKARGNAKNKMINSVTSSLYYVEVKQNSTTLTFRGQINASNTNSPHNMIYFIHLMSK